MASLSTIAPGYAGDYRDTSRTSLSIVRPAGHHHHGHREHERLRDPSPVTIQEPIIEHEHHHLHHHIDHGDLSGRQLAMARAPEVSRPRMSREYSYDDLDLRERRYANGTAVTTISHSHDHAPSTRTRRHRHRHRQRGHSGSVERTRYTRSEVDLGGYSDITDDLTVIDVPVGTRRVYVNVEKSAHGASHREHPPTNIDWRRERGVRRSRGLGNELWTEITKDLITREAIEDCGYQYEETDYFYYIFEYLDRDQIAELRELTEDIRRERVHDLEYQSIAGGSQYGLDRHDRIQSPRAIDFDDNRTEIIIESGSHGRETRPRRRYYH